MSTALQKETAKVQADWKALKERGLKVFDIEFLEGSQSASIAKARLSKKGEGPNISLTLPVKFNAAAHELVSRMARAENTCRNDFVDPVDHFALIEERSGIENLTQQQLREHILFEMKLVAAAVSGNPHLRPYADMQWGLATQAIDAQMHADNSRGRLVIRDLALPLRLPDRHAPLGHVTLILNRGRHASSVPQKGGEHTFWACEAFQMGLQ